jgi:4-amino-4-deoxy-L-arabinose transferase-like glycosyltransferase
LWPWLWLALLCIACLTPFLNKAFHIDDTLFVYAARQIQKNPLDFYGFTVNWYGTEMPMGGDLENPEQEGVMQNPPLASYYIALIAAILGWSEPALHLAFLFPAVAAVWGTYYLAKSLCRHPVLAALATLLTPAFLVSSTNVMCDTLTLAFWVWAVAVWGDGLRQRQIGLLFLAAILISLAALSKYVGVALIPLLLVYTVVHQWKDGQWVTDILTPCLPLAIPVLVLFVYQELTEALYGHGLLFQAIGYAAGVRQSAGHFALEVLGGLCFIGGGMASVLFYTPYLWSRWQLLAGLALVVVLVVGVALTFQQPTDPPLFSFGPGLAPASGQDARPVPWLGILQYAVLTAAGFGLAVLTVLDLWQRRDAGSLLLALWVGGIFLFATYFNWTLNVRSILPLLPAGGILIARRLDRRFASADAGKRLRLSWPLVPAGILALLVTWADYRMANAAREAAAEIVAASAGHPGKLWFQGHWGFQYYMEAAGARAVDFSHEDCKPGDLIVNPNNNSNVHPDFPPEPKIKRNQLNANPCRWLASFDGSVGASFYAAIYGPLPFAFGHVLPTQYSVFEIARANPGRTVPR